MQTTVVVVFLLFLLATSLMATGDMFTVTGETFRGPKEGKLNYGINNRPEPFEDSQIYVFPARIFTYRNMKDGRTMLSFGVLSFSQISKEDGEWYGRTTAEIFEFFGWSKKSVLGLEAFWYKRTGGTPGNTQIGDANITNFGKIGVVVSRQGYMVKLKLCREFVYNTDFARKGFWTHTELKEEGEEARPLSVGVYTEPKEERKLDSASQEHLKEE